MSEPKVEFKWLEAKCLGTDTVVFKLEDGATVKIKVDLDRAGVAEALTNPDGTPHYNVGASLKVSIIPANKSFYIPRSQLRTAVPTKVQKVPFIK